MPEHALAKNAYTCETCGGTLITVNRDAGVTPAFVPCRLTPDCKGWMHSHWYRVDQTLPATWEWYAPDAAELERATPATRAHVARGGLLLRPIPTEPHP